MELKLQFMSGEENDIYLTCSHVSSIDSKIFGVINYGYKYIKLILYSSFFLQNEMIMSI